MNTAQTAPTEAVSRPFAIHVVDPYEGFGRSLQRLLERRLGPDVRCSTSATPEAFFRSMAAGDVPQVVVTSNLHDGTDGLRLAARLRREGYDGKIFLFTGGARPQPTADLDGIYQKAHDHEGLLTAIEAAFRASR